MAEVLNKCSAKNRGEQRLAHLLQSFDDPNLLLAFTIDFIPGCREIDLLLAHKDMGLFVIEVKAVPLSAITSVSANSWKIEGRTTDENPLRQAYAQYEGLRSHWDARMRSKFSSTCVCVTACLPEITRREWTRSFPSNSYPSSIAEGMIFQDDLLDFETLNKRLSISMLNPPIRKGRKPDKLSQATINDLQGLFQASFLNSATISDRARLQAIERQITKELLKEFPIDGSAFSYYTGHPGTGKTFRLLSVGSAHAYSGKKVLFSCFNKTLASDVRRLLSFNDKLNHVDYNIDCADVFQLAKRAFEMNNFSYTDTDSPNEWGSLVVTELKNTIDTAVLDRYDTLLVDEAHDMMDWQLELLELHAKLGATICIAVGKGQELYRNDSSATQWLDDMAKGGKVKSRPLRRNFRNTKSQYFAALAFHQAWPDNIGSVLQTHKEVFSRAGGKALELEFGREGEALTYYPLPELEGEFEDLGVNQTLLLTAEYASIIQTEIEQQRKTNGLPVGILVLVPSENGQHANVARESLQRLSREMENLSFLDYTKDENRRSVATSNDVRLCTFHSSRGLEGECVIIFGLETIENLAEKTHVKAENLAFIALSRAIFRTVLVVRTFSPNRVHALLKEIVQIDMN